MEEHQKGQKCIVRVICNQSPLKQVGSTRLIVMHSREEKILGEQQQSGIHQGEQPGISIPKARLQNGIPLSWCHSQGCLGTGTEHSEGGIENNPSSQNASIDDVGTKRDEVFHSEFKELGGLNKNFRLIILLLMPNAGEAKN